jgi:myo-inositol-1(or 4)-monophosphatase
MISHPELDLALKAALAAGRVLKAEFGAGSNIRSESQKDIKLEADVHAETIILEHLRAASPHPILSEEAGPDAEFSRQGYHWVVDPLDGTFNFSRGIPLWCVSIGLWNGDRPVLGVINEPIPGNLYAGIIGGGAWRNDIPIRVSSIDNPARAALATGFPAERNFGINSLMGFVQQASTYKKVRLVGSAAISLTLVASGSVEAYQEDDIQYWDVAAGLALVEAAGGRIRMEARGSRWQRNVFATNSVLPLLIH